MILTLCGFARVFAGITFQRNKQKTIKMKAPSAVPDSPIQFPQPKPECMASG
jgi:hypothetical protein